MDLTARTLSRRTALQLLVGAGAVAVVGCSTDDGTSTAASSSSSSSSSTAGAAGTATSAAAADASCEVVPEETAGPFPGDGSNGPDYRTMDGAVRRDIRSSLGSDEAVPGVPLELELTVVDVAAGCTPLAGAAVYAWHCDAEGTYSMYDGAEDATFCRGIQATDDQGRLTFTTVFPGCYPGRWPHVHFEVYASVDDATGGGQPIATSQLAFDRAISEAVYAEAAYGSSAGNLARLSIEADMIFADGYDDQLATTTGSPASWLAGLLTVGV